MDYLRTSMAFSDNTSTLRPFGDLRPSPTYSFPDLYTTHAFPDLYTTHAFPDLYTTHSFPDLYKDLALI